MNVLIIEDEPIAARQLKALLLAAEPDMQVVGMLDSIEKSVDWLTCNPTPDLILLDIELVDGQSFDIFSQVEVRSPVIFTTAYDEFALKAFQVNSIDYLLKPIVDKALRRALQKFRQMKQALGAPDDTVRKIESLLNDFNRKALPETSYRERFLIRQGQRLLPVEVTDVSYFFSQNKLSFIKTYDNRQYLLDYSLDELEESLDPRKFYRANRQFILSHKSVDKVHLYFSSKLKVILQPASDEDVIVSREKATAFRRWLGE